MKTFKLTFFLISLIVFAVSCSMKKEEQAFPYSNSSIADTLGCIKSKSNKVDPLIEPDNGDGIGSQSYDSVLQEGVLAETSNAECDKSMNSYPYSDPLLKCQWHIWNRGEGIKDLSSSSSYYSNNGYKGADLRLMEQINGSPILGQFSGQNYRVHISDSGIQSNHEDLAANFDLTNSMDYCNASDKNPEPKAKPGETIIEDHGTSVAGIIAATSGNAKGGVGIVSKAKISVDNAVSICGVTASAWIAQIKQAGVAIWNGSFGTDTDILHSKNSQGFEIINDAISGHIADVNSTTGTNPTAYFKAAGNEGSQGGNANRDPLGWNPWVAHIGALNQFFDITYYSSSGSNILVSAFGAGEGNGSGVCTTAYGNKYTCDFNGTSSSTPEAAAVALLIKEAGYKAGKNLSALDLYYIMARTSIPIDEDKDENSLITNKPYINYSVNAAGYRHSVHYGFGAINTAKAVALAQDSTYQPLPNIKSYSATTSSDCTDLVFKTNASCAIRKIIVPIDMQIFSTRISLDIRPNYEQVSSNTSVIGEVFAFLIQPDGTRSEIMRSQGTLKGNDYAHDQFFKSYAPFATNAKGDWYIEVCAEGSIPVDFYFRSANLRIYGFNNSNPIPEKN